MKRKNTQHHLVSKLRGRLINFERIVREDEMSGSQMPDDAFVTEMQMDLERNKLLNCIRDINEALMSSNSVDDLQARVEALEKCR